MFIGDPTFGGGAAAGAKAGAVVGGMVAGPAGAPVGAVVGATVGWVVTAYAGTKVAQYVWKKRKTKKK